MGRVDIVARKLISFGATVERVSYQTMRLTTRHIDSELLILRC